jgi:hypothetical protein
MPKDSERDIITDAFHDGEKVFPQIREWHELLKRVMRKSDVVTSLILDLVDEHLLIKDRVTSDDLCKRLDVIISKAEKVLREEKDISRISDRVKQALLCEERARPIRLSANRETEPSGSVEVQASTTDAKLDGNPLRIPIVRTSLKSNRNTKTRNAGSRRRSSLASTSHREEILKKDLARSGLTGSLEASDVFSTGNTAKEKQQMPELARSQESDSEVDHQDSDYEVNSRSNLQGQTLDVPVATSGHSATRSQELPREMQSLAPAVASINQKPVPSPNHAPITIWKIVEGKETSAAEFVCLEVILGNDEKTAKDTNGNGCSPIMLAAKNFNVELVSRLFDYSKIQQQDEEGKTVLHYAVMRSSSRDDSRTLEMVKKITSRADEDRETFVNMLDESNRSPLYYCVTPGLRKTADHLIDCGAWTIPPKGSNGADFYTQAVDEGKDDMVELFLHKHPELIKVDLSSVDPPKSISELLKKKKREAESGNSSNSGKSSGSSKPSIRLFRS